MSIWERAQLSWQPAEPDALAYPLTRPRERRTTEADRQRVREEMSRGRFAMDQPDTAPIPTSSPMGARISGLASLLQGTKSRITAPLRPLGEAVKPVAEAVDVALLKPTIPAKAVREVAEGLPIVGKTLSRPSRRFGKLLEEASLGLMEPQSDSPFTPRFEKVRPNIGEVAPSKAIEVAAEFGPSPVEAAQMVLMPGVGLGLVAAGRVKRGKQAAKVLSELGDLKKATESPSKMAERAALGVRDLSHLDPKPIQIKAPPSEVADLPVDDALERFISRAPGAQEPPPRVAFEKPLQAIEKQKYTVDLGAKKAGRAAHRSTLEEELAALERTDDIEPPSEDAIARALEREQAETIATAAGKKAEKVAKVDLDTIDLEPVSKLGEAKRVVDRNRVINMTLGRADDFIRNAAAATPRQTEKIALEALADGLKNSAREADKIIGERITETRQALTTIMGIKDKGKRTEVARRFARYIRDPEYRAIGTGSDTLDGLAETVMGALRRQRELGLAAGVDIGDIADYLPHYNPKFGEAIDLFDSEQDKAIGIVQDLYAKSNKPIPDPEQAKILLEAAKKDRSTNIRQELDAFSPHLQLSRTLDVPGHMTDDASEYFTGDGFVHSIEQYFTESGRKIGDSMHMGPKKEMFDKAMNEVRDPALREVIATYRERLVTPVFRRDLEGASNALLGTLRSLKMMSALGKSATLNVAQTAMTTLPRTVRTQGFTKAGKQYLQVLGEIATNSDEAHDWARKTGIIRDEVIRDLAEIQGGQPLGAFVSRFMDVTLFSPTELANNVMAGRMGRLYGSELADMARGVFSKETGQFVASKNMGKVQKEIASILDSNPDLAKSFMQSAELGGAKAVPEQILDEIGAQIAYKTQFRFSATHLPLAWLTPMGRTISQFKSFGYNYSRFLADDVVKPALKGDLGPLVTTGLAGAATGHMARMARRAMALDRAAFDDGVNLKETKYETARARAGAKIIPFAKELGLDDPSGIGWEILNAEAAALSFGPIIDAASAIERGEGGAVAAAAESFIPVLGSGVRLGEAALLGNKRGGVPRVLVEEYTPSPYGAAQTLSKYASEKGVYERGRLGVDIDMDWFSRRNDIFSRAQGRYRP